MRLSLIPLSLVLLSTLTSAHAADAAASKKPMIDAHRSDAVAPVSQPETDPALSNSGALVPGQSIRPEGTDEAGVPKTPMDKDAANSADVGTTKKNEKATRPSSGSSGSTSPTP